MGVTGVTGVNGNIGGVYGNIGGPDRGGKSVSHTGERAAPFRFALVHLAANTPSLPPSLRACERASERERCALAASGRGEGRMSGRGEGAGKSLASSASASSSSASSSLRDILQVPGNLSKSLIGLAQRASPGARKKKVAKKTSVNLFQALTAMKKGLQVWKLPHKHYLVGNPHICLLRLSRDEQYLYWYSHKTKAEVVVYREQIVAVESELPRELKSWKGYADSLAFTIHYHQAPSSGRQPQRQRDRGASEGVENVTFVCKNDTDHKIWTVTLQILLEVSDLQGSSTHNASSSPQKTHKQQQQQQQQQQRGGTSNREDSLASLLSTQVMTSEIGQIVRNIGAGDLDALTLTPSGSAKAHAVARSESRKSLALAQEAGVPAETSDLATTGGRESADLTTSSQQYDRRDGGTTESLISYQIGGDRVIADSWVWGRGMAKVGKYVHFSTLSLPQSPFR